MRLSRTVIQKFRWLGLTLALISPLLLPTVAPAAPQVVNLAPVSEFLVDSDSELTIEEVSSPAYETKFRPHLRDHFNFGARDATVWIKFRIKKPPVPPDGRDPLVLELSRPYPRLVRLYVPVVSGGRAGFIPFSAGLSTARPQDKGVRSTVFVLPRECNPTMEFYLGLRNPYRLAFNLRLMAHSEYERREAGIGLGLGLLMGILAAMALTGLIAGLIRRDRVFFYYFLNMSALMAFHLILSGPLKPFFTDHGRLFLGIPGLWWLAIVSAAALTNAFLSTRTKQKTFCIALTGLALAGISVPLLQLGGFLGEAYAAAVAISFVLILTIISATIGRYSQGYNPARFYLLGWLAFLTGVAVNGLAAVVQALPLNMAVHQASLIGSCAMAVLVSLALTERLRDLRQKRQALKEQERRIIELSVTDELTGVFNNRFFSSKLKSDLDHAHRVEQPLCLVTIDLDNFRHFNDAHGHLEGDVVLARLGLVIRNAIRDNDTPCRMGGEEFALLLPATDLTGALTLAERIRERFAEQRFSPGGQDQPGPTISLGVAQSKNGQDTPESLLDRAGAALDKAKEQGRNRTEAG